MSTISALNSGILGIQRGMDGLRRDAAEIASANTHQADSPRDMAAPLVSMIENKAQVAISAQVVKAIDETLGSLLDVMA